MPRRAHLVVVCGLPGSGKTTLARGLAEDLDAVRASADDWMDALGIDLWDQDARARVEALQWEVAQRLLRAGVDVVIEWGSWSRAERDALRDGAHRLGATAQLVHLDVPLDELARRIAARDREDPPITAADLAEWATLIETPTAAELATWDGPLDAIAGREHDTLVALETAMWETATRGDRAWMDAHLAPEFEEIGRSGRRWSRDEIVAAEVGTIDAVLPLPDLTVQALGPGLALVRYRSVVAGEPAHRTSLWRHTPDGWKLRFHQGTPTA